MITDYCARAQRSGRALGFTALEMHEADERKAAGRQGQAVLLQRLVPAGSALCALDERGKLRSSPDFAALLTRYRDQGTRDFTFLIGGADGLCDTLRQQSNELLSFGKMVWPHMLARVMLTEQIYRAISILSGAPYHRE